MVLKTETNFYRVDLDREGLPRKWSLLEVLEYPIDVQFGVDKALFMIGPLGEEYPVPITEAKAVYAGNPKDFSEASGDLFAIFSELIV